MEERYNGDSNGRIMIPTPVGEIDLLELNEYSPSFISLKSQLSSIIINVKDPMIKSLIPAKGNGVDDDSIALQGMINYLRNIGGILIFPRGLYKCMTGLVLYDGITLKGLGKNPVNGNPSRLDFSDITDVNSGISMSNASDINIEDLYITGRRTGSGHEINIIGHSRRINISRVIINTKTTGAGISTGLSLIISSINNVVVVGAGTGFLITSASTSVNVNNCYANVCNIGYQITGTYCCLSCCAADSNTLYGYVIQSASQIGLYSCGSEANGRGSLVLVNSTGITIDCFRSHGNNTSASTFFPSFLDIRNSDNIIISNCRDSSPNTSTSHSVTSTESNAGKNILFINSNFEKPIHPTLERTPAINQSFKIGVVSNTETSNNMLFVDSADNLLKFKNSAGQIQTITVV